MRPIAASVKKRLPSRPRDGVAVTSLYPMPFAACASPTEAKLMPKSTGTGALLLPVQSLPSIQCRRAATRPSSLAMLAATLSLKLPWTCSKPHASSRPRPERSLDRGQSTRRSHQPRRCGLLVPSIFRRCYLHAADHAGRLLSTPAEDPAASSTRQACRRGRQNSQASRQVGLAYPCSDSPIRRRRAHGHIRRCSECRSSTVYLRWQEPPSPRLDPPTERERSYK